MNAPSPIPLQVTDDHYLLSMVSVLSAEAEDAILQPELEHEAWMLLRGYGFEHDQIQPRFDAALAIVRACRRAWP